MSQSYCRVDVESNSLYTKTEFDSLSGYVTGQYTSEWQDKDGTRWRTTVTLINLGRPDRGVYHDPDAMIDSSEPFDDVNSTTNWQLAVAEHTQARHNREVQLVADLQKVFADHGPLTIRKLRFHVSADKARVLRALRNHRDNFTCFAHGVWGLRGQTWQPASKGVVRTKLVCAIRQCLLEHGEMSAPEIARRLGKRSQNVAHSLTVAPDWFAVVGERPRQGQTPEARIWDLTDAARRQP